jgi:hypothetical protein
MGPKSQQDPMENSSGYTRIRLLVGPDGWQTIEHAFYHVLLGHPTQHLINEYCCCYNENSDNKIGHTSSEGSATILPS